MNSDSKIPTNFSSLNNDVIPDQTFIEEIDKYTPKLSEEIVKQICEEKGLITTDPRLYIYHYIIEYSFRVIAIAAQSFVEDILTGTAESINCKKKNNKFLEWKELSEILKEKGITSNRTQFFCDNLNVNLDKPTK